MITTQNLYNFFLSKCEYNIILLKAFIYIRHSHSHTFHLINLTLSDVLFIPVNFLRVETFAISRNLNLALGIHEIFNFGFSSTSQTSYLLCEIYQQTKFLPWKLLLRTIIQIIFHLTKMMYVSEWKSKCFSISAFKHFG